MNGIIKQKHLKESEYSRQCYKEVQIDKTVVIPALLHASKMRKMIGKKEKFEGKRKKTHTLHK